MTITDDLLIRKATYDDLDMISELELCCFPEAEAAKKEAFSDRLEAYANHFLLAIYEQKVIGVVDGLVADEENLIDDMYDDTSFHSENGKWQMIFGVETHPEYQHQGIASRLMKAFVEIARSENRLGLVLTCKSDLMAFYEKFGFINEGVSVSSHGGVTWYQMRLRF